MTTLMAIAVQSQFGYVPLFGFLNQIGPPEILVLLVLGILLFGKRLPDVGRSLGKGIVEFKKGLRGIEDEINEQASRPDAPPPRSDRIEAEPPRFEVPPQTTKPAEPAQQQRTL